MSESGGESGGERRGWKEYDNGVVVNCFILLRPSAHEDEAYIEDTMKSWGA